MTDVSAGTVAVLIPTFNRAHYIEESLDSVLAQTRAPGQIIVIDDGSEDDTAHVVARYGDRVTYLHKENAGKSAALNYALPYVTGDYVWIFDDDDIALPEAAALLTEQLDRRLELGFVYSAHLLGRTDASGKIVETKLHRLAPIPENEMFLKLLKTYFFAMQGILVRSTCFKSVGPFNEAMLRSQDYEMMIRLARRYRAAPVYQPTFILRQHKGARGPKVQRHAGADAERTRIHLDFDGQLGRVIRQDLRLDEYVRGQEEVKGTPSSAEQRKALLVRMTVMASKGLLDEMLEDLNSACALRLEDDRYRTTLTQEERAICEEAMHYRYFWLRLKDDPDRFLRALRRCTETALGRQAVGSFAKSMAIHAKSYVDPLPERGRRLCYAYYFARLALGLVRRDA